jgi:hypothetical protein
MRLLAGSIAAAWQASLEDPGRIRSSPGSAESPWQDQQLPAGRIHRSTLAGSAGAPWQDQQVPLSKIHWKNLAGSAVALWQDPQ